MKALVMSVVPRAPRVFRVLFVACETQSIARLPSDEPNLLYVFADTPDDAVRPLSQTQYDCVIALIDPGNIHSMAALDALQSHVQNSGLPLACLSTFNPLWIENLTAQLGIEKLFRTMPLYDEIACFVRGCDRVKRVGPSRLN